MKNKSQWTVEQEELLAELAEKTAFYLCSRDNNLKKKNDTFFFNSYNIKLGRWSPFL